MNVIVLMVVYDFYVYITLATPSGQRINKVATVIEFPPATIQWLIDNNVKVHDERTNFSVWEAALSDMEI